MTQKGAQMPITIKILKENLRPEVRNWPIIIGLSLMIIGISLAILIPTESLVTKLLIALVTEFGFAFFIAHIIIVTVDAREKENFLRAMEEAHERFEHEQQQAERRLSLKIYLSHLLDIELPKTISDELSEYLVRSKLIKRKQTIHYKLTPYGDYTLFSQILDATYENVHTEDFPYTTLFETYSEQHEKLLGKHFQDAEIGIVEASFFVQNPEGEMEELPPDRYEVDKSSLMIKDPVVLRQGDRIRNRVVHNAPKNADDNELFTNSQLSESLQIYIEYDKSVFEVGYRAIHARASDCMHVSKRKTEDILQFRYPFLPSNGVMVWWHRKE